MLLNCSQRQEDNVPIMMLLMTSSRCIPDGGKALSHHQLITLLSWWTWSCHPRQQECKLGQQDAQLPSLASCREGHRLQPVSQMREGRRKRWLRLPEMLSETERQQRRLLADFGCWLLVQLGPMLASRRSSSSARPLLSYTRSLAAAATTGEKSSSSLVLKQALVVSKS